MPDKMKCRVEGCDRDAVYFGDCLCQKHYFRKWRYGTTELTRRKARPRITMPGKGYQFVHDPSHPLAHKNGYVAEHRKVVFDRIGFSLCACEMCGKPEAWETVHIDHIDQDPKNNNPENLRPLCRSCNVWRDYPDQHTFKSNLPVTLGDVTLTPTEWARLTGGYLCAQTIRRRINRGMSHEQSLTAPKETHGRGSKPPYTRETLIEIARYYREQTRKLKNGGS